MLRTKHAVIAVATIVILMAVVYGWLQFTASRSAMGEFGPLTYVEESALPAVVIESTKKDTSIRERIIAKLSALTTERESKPAAVAEPAVEEVSAEPATDTTGENGVIEGGQVLGDGKQSVRPKMGYVYLCAAPLRGTSGGATPWIEDGFWRPELKPEVGGALPGNGSVAIAQANSLRTITSNALPQHATGVFSDGTATAKTINVSLPLAPQVAPTPYCISTGAVGVALNGVPIYAGQNAFGEDAVAHELLDQCGGRPSENGVYHYYSESSCLRDRYNEGAPSTILGYALDGFGIFSSIENGASLTNSDLDSCHGHEHIIPWNGEMVSVYHYHMTDEFPYTVGCFMGEPTSL